MNAYLLPVFHVIIFITIQLVREGEANSLLSELRIATFGTSRTFGALLHNRTAEAYPYLLSEHTKNYAIRGSDARYPSMCLQSMLSNSTFDVIIVEYDRYTNNLHTCIIEMIRRLRTRFPKCIIILTNIWLLWDIDVVLRDERRIKFPRWIDLNKNRLVSPSEIISHAEMTNATFVFNPITYKSVTISQKIADMYNVKLYSWFGDNANAHSSVQAEVTSRISYFEDFLHWNKMGHLQIATDINRIILESQQRQRQNVYNNNYQQQILLGEWTENDICSLWIQTGIIDNKLYFKFPSNVHMIKMHADATKEKYALQLPSSSSSSSSIEESTIFHVENPFSKSQHFYLTFMVSHPNRLYPKMLITISSPSNTTNAAAIPTSTRAIDPFEDHGYPAHFPVLAFIGILHPGINYLIFKPMQVTEFPFRIIGYSISEVPLDSTNSSSSYSWYF